MRKTEEASAAHSQSFIKPCRQPQQWACDQLYGAAVILLLHVFPRGLRCDGC